MLMRWASLQHGGVEPTIIGRCVRHSGVAHLIEAEAESAASESDADVR